MAELTLEDKRQLERSPAETHKLHIKGQILNDVIGVMQGSRDPHEVAEKWAEKVVSLEQEKIRDGLTGAYNRAYVGASLQRELVLTRKHGEPLGLFFIDLDYLKSVNDEEKDHTGADGQEYKGQHDAGDRTLVGLAGLMQETFGETAVVGRWGGEEWVVVLPDCDADKLRELGLKLGGRVRQTLAARANLVRERVTASIGATLARPEDTAVTLIQRADKLVYEAKGEEEKEGGRDRLVLEVEAEKREILPFGGQA